MSGCSHASLDPHRTGRVQCACGAWFVLRPITLVGGTTGGSYPRAAVAVLPSNWLGWTNGGGWILEYPESSARSEQS
jgi:hypothetical protein